MKSLSAFLNPIRSEEKEVVVSNRFIEDGKAVPFVIRAINQKENEALIRKHTKQGKNGPYFDQTGYSHAITAAGVVFPDLKNAELQKAYNVVGENELLKEMLLVGEYAVLSEEIQKLSGLNSDINDHIEEVKN